MTAGRHSFVRLVIIISICFVCRNIGWDDSKVGLDDKLCPDCWKPLKMRPLAKQWTMIGIICAPGRRFTQIKRKD